MLFKADLSTEDNAAEDEAINPDRQPHLEIADQGLEI